LAQPTDTEWPSEPRTLLKHQIYKRYVDCWMGKILQRFPSATIVDAFAGPGGYSDGPDGSPLVVAKAYLNHTGRDRLRSLRLICNEARPDRNEALARRLADLPTDRRLDASVVEPASTFEDAISLIERRAHPGGDPLPTLWLLDPFNIKSVPFELVARCLRGPRDEVLLTWFADEIYRFGEVPWFQVALTTHYGGDHWRQALVITGEHHRKAAFMRLYRERLETLPGVRTGEFSITSKNETARYSIVLATHSDSGLVCWNPVKWGLDPAAGRSASERGIAPLPLFDERSSLRAALAARAGTAASFSELRTEAGRLGFLDRQLRATLDEMREDATAIRESPLDARSPWPENCVVRFYEARPTGEVDR
jgi:three-Cys-motif partner protein